MSNKNDWNKAIIEEFRENKGVVGGNFENMPLLLLHTTGAKSGNERVNPVAYLPEGEQLFVVASKGGAPSHPDWYHNLVAHPNVRVELGTEEFQAQAKVTEEPQRTKLLEKMVAKNPGFAEYLKMTTRTIPVIMLSRSL